MKNSTHDSFKSFFLAKDSNIYAKQAACCILLFFFIMNSFFCVFFFVFSSICFSKKNKKIASRENRPRWKCVNEALISPKGWRDVRLVSK